MLSQVIIKDVMIEEYAGFVNLSPGSDSSKAACEAKVLPLPGHRVALVFLP